MKKYLFFLISILFFVSTGFGQWSVGPRVGVNFSTITGQWSNNDNSKSKWTVSPAFGVVGRYSFNDMLSLNAELLFVGTGGKTIHDDEGERDAQSTTSVTIKEHSHYLQLPILIQAFFGSNFIFFANIGPYCALKIANKEIVDDGENKTTWNAKFKEDTGQYEENDYYHDPNYWRRFDLGMYVGGGVGKKLGPGIVEADLRLGIGFLDHNKFENKEEKQEYKDDGYKSFRNTNICLTFTYMFGFGNDQATRFID